MLIMILAKIIVTLGVAALAALIISCAVLTLQNVFSLIKNKLAMKIGGTVVIANMRVLAKEAIEEARRNGTAKKLSQLEELAKKEGFAMAVQDTNGNISPDDVEIYQAEEMDDEIYGMMDESGLLVIEA